MRDPTLAGRVTRAQSRFAQRVAARAGATTADAPAPVDPVASGLDAILAKLENLERRSMSDDDRSILRELDHRLSAMEARWDTDDAHKREFDARLARMEAMVEQAASSAQITARAFPAVQKMVEKPVSFAALIILIFFVGMSIVVEGMQETVRRGWQFLIGAVQ